MAGCSIGVTSHVPERDMLTMIEMGFHPIRTHEALSIGGDVEAATNIICEPHTEK